MAQHPNLNTIARTSDKCYAHQGPGIGAGKDTLRFHEMMSGKQIKSSDVVLDIGYGKGASLLEVFLQRGVHECIGVDIAQKCEDAEETAMSVPEGCVFTSFIMDVCHEELPMADDSVDVVFCTETIEHLANPYHMVAEAKRVLKHGGFFTLAFPQPENNLGYGGGQHAHVYPGFLQKASFERFMKQMFFRLMNREENGASAWYTFRNYKGAEVIDVFEVVSGNYNEQDLYGCLDHDFEGA